MRSAMIRLFFLGVLALCLSACATSPANDVSNGSDLDVLVMGVDAMTEPRGENLKQPENVTDTEEAWHLLLDLDDVKWLSNRDKAGIRKFVRGAVERIKESRKACTSFDRWFNLRECT